MGLPALQIPKIAGPMDNMSQAMQLKNMMQQGQLGQQAIQSGNIDLQEKQQQLNDQKAMTAAMHEWDGKELDQLPTLILKHGGSSTAVMGMKSKVLEQKKTYAQIAKDDAETGKNQTETALKRNDMLLGQLNTVTDGQSLLQVAQSAAQQGLLDPQHLQIAQQWSQLPPDQLKAHLDVFKKSLQADSVQRKTAMDQVDMDLKKAQTPGAEAKSAQEVRANAATQLSTAYQNGGVQGYVKTRMGMPYSIAKDFPDMPKSADEILQPGMTPHEQSSIPVDKLELKDFLAKNPGKTPSDFIKFKAANSPMMMNNTQLLSPDALQTAGEFYRKTGTIPSGFSRSPATSAAVIAEAARQAKAEGGATPDIAQNKIDFNTRKALDKDFFGGGKSSQNIRSLNTAIGHLGMLADAADALQNGDIKALNKIGNFFKVQTGASAPSVFDAIKTAATGELGSTFKGSAATDPEIANLAATLNKDLSGNVNKDVIKTDAKLLGSRLYALEQQYAQSGGKAAPKGKILYSHSANILGKMGVKVEGDEPQGGNTQPQGGGKTIHYKVVNGQLVPE
jgi:hypothetical protein